MPRSSQRPRLPRRSSDASWEARGTPHPPFPADNSNIVPKRWLSTPTSSDTTTFFAFLLAAGLEDVTEDVAGVSCGASASDEGTTDCIQLTTGDLDG